MALTKISTDGVKDDAITKTKIPANQIEASELADNAVDTNAIADNAVTTAKIPDNAVSSAKIPTNAVTQAKIADDAVGADQLASNAVVTASIADNAITQAKINVPISNRNLIINGAMKVAQRGTSSTSTGYQTVDRISHFNGGTDENPTYAQADVASGTTPYSLGFRKSFKITNGNQTSGAGADDYIHFVYKVEAQDLANSGWNYTSSSSNITLSFWVKASVAQNYYGYLLTADGSTRSFAFETGSLSADTWTKVTVVIPGNSNLTFNNDNGNGLEIDFSVFRGTGFTGTAGTVGSWVSFTSSQRHPDCTPTWYTTNDATFELTGVQLEVGSTATDFEHRSFAQELQLCKRYYEQITPKLFLLGRYSGSGGSPFNQLFFEVEKRANPTASHSGNFESGSGFGGDPNFTQLNPKSCAVYGSNSVSANENHYLDDNGDALMKFDAEI